MIAANDGKKDETRGTAAGLLNDRMMLSVRQAQTTARRSRHEKLGRGEITVSWYHGGVSHIGVACRWLQSYCDNERKVAVRKIVLGP